MLAKKSPSTAAGGPIRIRAVPQRQSLVSAVVEQLARQVRSGAVAPGSRLPAESELSRRFDVSRTVVREAVSRLKADELVETLPGQGLYVKRPAAGQGVLRFKAPLGDASQIESELLEFRAGIEADSARLAASRRTAADLKALKRAFIRLAAVRGEARTGSDEDLAFHLEIARASHNSYIIQVLEFVSGSMRIAITRSREMGATRQEFLAQAHAEHTAIHDAIVRADPQAAVEAMRAHLEAGQRRLLASPPT